MSDEIELQMWNQISYDSRSYEHNFSTCRWKSAKFRTSTGSTRMIAYLIPHQLNFIIHLFLTGSLEPTNDQLPTSVAS